VKLICLISISAVFLTQGLLAQKPPAIPPDATPKEVGDLIRATAEALQNKDVSGFLDHFDGKMPGYEMLHFYLEGLAARDSVLSSIEIVTDKGDKDSDGQRRTLQLDWVLNIDSERTARGIVKVTVEKQGKKWKFTSLDPVDFFKPPAQ
jgi:hypothetical protein